VVQKDKKNKLKQTYINIFELFFEIIQSRKSSYEVFDMELCKGLFEEWCGRLMLMVFSWGGKIRIVSR